MSGFNPGGGQHSGLDNLSQRGLPPRARRNQLVGENLNQSDMISHDGGMMNASYYSRGFNDGMDPGQFAQEGRDVGARSRAGGTTAGGQKLNQAQLA